MAALDGWVEPMWASGPWRLDFEDQVIWSGDEPSVTAREEALLEAWWGSGGHGCC